VRIKAEIPMPVTTVVDRHHLPDLQETGLGAVDIALGIPNV